MRLILLFVVPALSLVWAQSPGGPPPLIQSLEGKDLYRAYCASCHGLDGKGTGPAAAALKVVPPDLATISRRNKGKFPRQRIEEIISGDGNTTAAHGSRDMPVWGPLFSRINWDRNLSPVRLRNLSAYIESLQKK